MQNTMFTSPFDAPPAGELVAVELDPRRQVAHRAIAGYLAGYSGATLDAYRLDLRQWVIWLDGNGVDILSVQRAHIELYARWSDDHGLARSTISRRLSTICGFYRYCSQEAVIDRDPAAYVRRPKLDYESHTIGLDRNELGAFPVQAGLCGGRDHALMCLLALNGLRISEAPAALDAGARPVVTLRWEARGRRRPIGACRSCDLAGSRPARRSTGPRGRGTRRGRRRRVRGSPRRCHHRGRR